MLIAPGVVAIAWASQFIGVTPALHTAAAFVHLACVVVGFGSVLVVDWFGLRWQFGLTSLEKVVSVAGDLAAPIWLGLAGLVLSGMLLEPALDSAATQVKIGMVAGAALIGMLALMTQRRLRAELPLRPRGLVRGGMLLAVASQICWWGATVIGFLNRT